MKKIIIRVVLALVVVGVTALLLVGFYLDKIVKRAVEKVGPMITQVDVKVDNVSLSLLTGGGTVQGLTVGNPEGYKSPTAMKVGKATLAIAPRSLLSDKVVVRTIQLESPEITLETDLKANNLNDILKNVEKASGSPGEPAPKNEGPGKKLQVDDFLIRGAKLNLIVTSPGGESMTLALPEIHLEGLGQGPEGITAANLVDKVLSKVESTAIDTAKASGKDLAIQELKKATSEATKKLQEGIDGLFKKKEK